jgi:hypothetical protein
MLIANQLLKQQIRKIYSFLCQSLRDVQLYQTTAVDIIILHFQGLILYQRQISCLRFELSWHGFRLATFSFKLAHILSVGTIVIYVGMNWLKYLYSMYLSF